MSLGGVELKEAKGGANEQQRGGGGGGVLVVGCGRRRGRRGGGMEPCEGGDGFGGVEGGEEVGVGVGVGVTRNDDEALAEANGHFRSVWVRGDMSGDIGNEMR